MGEQTQLDVAVVVPAYNAEHQLAVSLPAILAAAGRRRVIVVDAGSDDRSGGLADELGARVIRLPRRAGPAEARNTGANAADGADVVLFCDADCVPQKDVVDRVQRAFEHHPDMVSLTGSYDAAPAAPGFFSDYMNLRHHHVHQHAKRVGASFWAGCGAVRLQAFHAVGGFDATRYPVPMIEDIELGGRIGALGETRLDPDLQVKHLKQWSLASVVKTDILHRAIPWSRLILEQGELPADLNTAPAQRLAAAVAPFALIAAIGIPITASFEPLWSLAWLIPLAASWYLNRGMFIFFAQTRGPAFATGAWLFHQLHLSYSAATFALLWAHRRLRPTTDADTAA